MQNNINGLYHSGIKGMRWGVRNNEKSSNQTTHKKIKAASNLTADLLIPTKGVGIRGRFYTKLAKMPIKQASEQQFKYLRNVIDKIKIVTT